MSKVTRMGILVAAAILQMAAFADTAALPPPCDPVPVKKPVKVVKREISVAIIGVGRPSMPANRKPTWSSNTSRRASIRRAAPSARSGYREKRWEHNLHFITTNPKTKENKP